MAAIALSGVGLARRGTWILRDIDLVVEDAERVCLLGPSGAGKSALLRLVAGLGRPTTGSITVGGRPPEPGRGGTTFLGEDHPVYSHRDVRANLGFPRRDHDVDVRELASRFALGDLLSRPAGRLSAGERTGVAAARALARPDVGTVLLDAPGRGVDPALRRRIMEAVMAVRGRTVLFSTRLPEEALRWADRVVVLVGGAVHQVAPPREVLVRPASIEAAAAMGEVNRLPGTGHDRAGRVRVGSSLVSVRPVLEGVEPGRRVIVGVRPADLAPASPEAPFQERLRVTIGRVASVGARQRVEFGVGTEPAAAFAAEFEPARRLTVGDRIDWHVPPEAVRLYDPVTGRAL